MNQDKIILDLCGGTGSWSKPYKDAGYDVRVITLPDYDVTQTQVGTDGYLYFYSPQNKGTMDGINPKNIYGVLAAPPCTKFSKADWRRKKGERDFKEGMRCVRSCMEIIWSIQEDGAPLKFWALENPMGYLYNFLGQPAYYFQPWQFGETGFTATKRTAIWGYFKEPKKTVSNRLIPYINPHTSNRMKKLSLFPLIEPKKENLGWYKASAAERAVTPQGFAKAFYEANK